MMPTTFIFDELISPEEKESASRHFVGKENDIFEYGEEVSNWILECEAKISDQLDGLSEVDKQSQRSCSLRSSRTSRSSLCAVGLHERKSQGRRINGRTLHAKRKTKIASCGRAITA